MRRAVYHREVRTVPEHERRRLSRSQRHYIEEWVHLLAPLRRRRVAAAGSTDRSG
jgi:hypothetical protein